MMQKVDSALLFYNRSLSLYGTYESNLNNKGALYYTFYFDYVEAIKSFKISTNFNETYYEGMLNIGNSYCKLAEGYDNLLKVIPNSETKKIEKVVSINDYYLSNKLYKTLGIIRQFEVNARTLLKSGLNDNSAQTLSQNAKNLEKLDPNLQHLNFSKRISDGINTTLATRSQIDVNFLSIFIKELIDLITSSTNSSEEEIRIAALILKKSYIDSAKIYYQKTYNLKPDFQLYYSSVNDNALQLSDYQLLIDIQKKYIKNFNSKYNAPQYIQLANAYYSLGKLADAKMYFKKGMNDLSKEREDLLKKSEKSVEDQTRINALENEISRLTQFVLDLKRRNLIN